MTSPRGKTRPTNAKLRAALFNMCQDLIQDSSFLDLCAGSGAMGFEAISRGALRATFIDSSPLAISCIKQNSEMLKVQKQVEILKMDLVKALKKLQDSFDLIYFDPPYDQAQKLVKDAGPYLQPLLAEHGLLFIETRVNTEIELPDNLSLQDERRFGDSLLRTFQM